MVYALLVKPIPDGMVIDHICHDPLVCTGRDRECPHRRCQNPRHHAIVTRAANALRSASPPALNALSDRCDKGHLYVPGSYTETEGHRRCLICRRDTDQRRRPRGVPRKDVPRTGVRQFMARGDNPARRARDAEIVRLRDSGMTFTAVGAELKISATFASAQYNRLTGVTAAAAAKVMEREARQARAKEMSAAGRSPSEIAAALGISRATVFRDLAGSVRAKDAAA